MIVYVIVGFICLSFGASMGIILAGLLNAASLDTPKLPPPVLTTYRDEYGVDHIIPLNPETSE